MGPAQMLHQRIYDADICLRQSGDADGGGADRSVLFCAAAQTARNVKALATIAKDGFGFLLMAVGLIAVFYFALRLSDKRKNG